MDHYLLVFFLYLFPVNWQELIVIDGDTFNLNGEKIRFSGIDTPELKQFCVMDDKKNSCGLKAKQILVDKIGDLKVTCIREGKVICAVIIDPVRDHVFCAGEGTGALLNNKRIRASSKTHLSNALLSSTGHNDKDQNYVYSPLETYKLLNEFDVTVRRSGCTSLDIAYCAAGKLDGFWGHGLKPWDRLAALFIAQSSGCLISDFEGTPDTYKSDHMIIATPKCFKDLSKCVRAGYQSKE